MNKWKSLFFELMRFGIVGVIAFVFDWGFLMLTLKFIFAGVQTSFTIAVATAVGFIVGVTVNYIMSVLFVFKNAKKGAGKTPKAAVIFLVSAIIGMLLTQVIMNAGTIQMGYDETLTKVAATLIVMIWNYISRKLLIFKSE